MPGRRIIRGRGAAADVRYGYDPGCSRPLEDGPRGAVPRAVAAALGLTPQLLQLARLLRRSVILTGNTHKHHIPKSITATCSAASVNVVAPSVQVMGVSPTSSRATVGAGESKRIVAVRGSGLSLKTVK